jgi:hypothetical protein
MYLFNLDLAGAIEAAAGIGEEATHELITVALDGIERLPRKRSDVPKRVQALTRTFQELTLTRGIKLRHFPSLASTIDRSTM